jgi:hypothetical protein
MWVSNVTQVPSIIGRVADTFSDVYPRPGASCRPPADHVILASQIMRHHRTAFGVGKEAIFDETRFVIQNAYTGGSNNLKKTFAAVQKHRNDAYNEFCARELDYARGDDFLQIGRVDVAALCRQLFGSSRLLSSMSRLRRAAEPAKLATHGLAYSPPAASTPNSVEKLALMGALDGDAP